MTITLLFYYIVTRYIYILITYENDWECRVSRTPKDDIGAPPSPPQSVSGCTVESTSPAACDPHGPGGLIDGCRVVFLLETWRNVGLRVWGLGLTRCLTKMLFLVWFHLAASPHPPLAPCHLRRSPSPCFSSFRAACFFCRVPFSSAPYRLFVSLWLVTFLVTYFVWPFNGCRLAVLMFHSCCFVDCVCVGI